MDFDFEYLRYLYRQPYANDDNTPVCTIRTNRIYGKSAVCALCFFVKKCDVDAILRLNAQIEKIDDLQMVNEIAVLSPALAIETRAFSCADLAMCEENLCEAASVELVDPRFAVVNKRVYFSAMEKYSCQELWASFSLNQIGGSVLAENK